MICWPPGHIQTETKYVTRKRFEPSGHKRWERTHGGCAELRNGREQCEVDKNKNKSSGGRGRSPQNRHIETIAESQNEWTVMVYLAIDNPGQAGMDVIQRLKSVA